MVDKLRSGYMNIVLLLLVLTAVVLVPGASANPGYASQTGKSCDYCHVDPNGGGTLTAAGDVFVSNGHKMPVATLAPEALSIIAPANIAAEATGILTNVADLGVQTITGGTPPYTTINDAPLGGNFAVGDTIVTWTATDSVNAVATAIQTVTITDTGTVPPAPPLSTTGGVLNGKVFKDLNKDEELSVDEVGLAGMPVKLTGTGVSTKGVHMRTLTDADGNFQFSDLKPGRYAIHSKFKSGWVSTTRVTFVVLDLKGGQTVVANFGKTKNVHMQEGGNSAITESVQTGNADVQKVAKTVTTNSGKKKSKHTEEVAETVTTNSGKKKSKHTEEVAETVTTSSGKKKNKHTE
jgi:hypothetical protein